MQAVIAICLGASAGALARWQLGLWLNQPQIALGTLAANWIGGYLIGVGIAIFEAWPALNPTWRLALITGFLGALTTFSTFSAEVVQMLLQQRYTQALITSSLHLVGSLALTVAGMRSVQWVLAHWH